MWTLILVYFVAIIFGQINGIEFNFAAVNSFNKDSLPCGQVRCKDEVGTSQGNSIKQLTMRARLNGETFVVDLSQHQTLFSRNESGIHANGTWTSQKAEAQLILYSSHACNDAEFTCEIIHSDKFGVERASSGQINAKFSNSGQPRSTTIPSLEQNTVPAKGGIYNASTALAAALQLSAIIQKTQTVLAGRIEHVQDRLVDKLFDIQNTLALIEKSVNNYRSYSNNGDTACQNNSLPNVTQICTSKLGQDIKALASAVTLAAEDSAANATRLFHYLANIESRVENHIATSNNKTLSKLETLAVNINQNNEVMKKEQLPTTCSRDVNSVQEKRYQVVYPSDGSSSYLCDTDGGWTVIQRRVNGHTDFYRNWSSYKHGFGSFDGDFWLGLDQIHNITSGSRHQLVLSMMYGGKLAYARYDNFYVGGEADNYRLSIGAYTGTAGDSLSYHHNQIFSTFDRDNDKFPSVNCAEFYIGAWWYDSCHNANLNGKWGEIDNKGMSWTFFSETNSVTMSEMKIRPMS